MSTRKNRGIRCSRLKLDAALASSDIPRKTQIALAEAIADQEELESVPKDLVNKMFRELPVDSQTIERVASVLGVSAPSLYLEEQEVQPKLELESESDLDNFNRKREEKEISRRSVALVAGIFVIGVLFLLFYIQPFQSTPENCYQPRSIERPSSSTDSISIVIGQLAGDPQNQAQLMLATMLASDKRLQGKTEIYTSCFSVSFDRNAPIREQITNGHKAARVELELYKAQLIVWGERLDDRVNLRFTSNGAPNQDKRLKLANKTIQTNENDFSFNIRLNDSESLTGDLQLVLLNLLSPQSNQEAELKNQLIQEYNYSGSWLKEAVISDANLLKRISKESDPKLYQLTVTQLCFRRRLLGDVESSDTEYLLAEEACNQALATINHVEEPMQWASVKGNLGTLMVRRQLYAKTQEDRLALLESARSHYSEVESIYATLASRSEAATFYQNFTAVYIRLAESNPAQAVELFERASELSSKSISLSNAEDNPFYSALRLQNQCMLKHRLGSLQKQPDRLQSAIEDCERAKTLITPKEYPAESAMILNNLAISHAILAELRSSISDFERALKSFESAQLIYTQQEFPLNWAEVEINKAELTCKLAILSKESDKMAQARTRAEAALLIFIQKDIKPYQNYAENLIGKIKECEKEEISDCGCSS